MNKKKPFVLVPQRLWPFHLLCSYSSTEESFLLSQALTCQNCGDNRGPYRSRWDQAKCLEGSRKGQTLSDDGKTKIAAIKALQTAQMKRQSAVLEKLNLFFIMTAKALQTETWNSLNAIRQTQICSDKKDPKMRWEWKANDDGDITTHRQLGTILLHQCAITTWALNPTRGIIKSFDVEPACKPACKKLPLTGFNLRSQVKVCIDWTMILEFHKENAVEWHIVATTPIFA